MSKEYLGHNPANFTPENFMRPATGVVEKELVYLSSQLRNAIEGSLRIDKGALLIGTELEVLFLSNQADPGKLERRYENRISRYSYLNSDDKDEIRAENNPNYSEDHRSKVLRIADFAKSLDKKYPEDYYNCTRDSKLLIEFRTAPQNLEDYYDNISWLADEIRKKAKNNGLLPVLHSQHLHLSCNSHSLRPYPKSKFQMFRESILGNRFIDSTFTRVLPMVMLPEEYERSEDVPSDIVIENTGEKTHEVHPEFRLLSSEYAFDNILNLTLCLRAFYSAYKNKDYATDTLPDTNFIKAVREMSKDKELGLFFGESTLAEICRIVKQYPSVSRRIKTINEVE